MIKLCHLEQLTIFRQSLQAILANDKELKIVQSWSTSIDITLQLPLLPVDLLFLDMELEGYENNHAENCLEVCKEIRRINPDLKIILHSPYRHMDWLDRFLQVGIHGVISKNAGLSEMIHCLKQISVVPFTTCELTSMQMVQAKKATSRYHNGLPGTMPHFTVREKSVLSLLIKGYTTKEMAASLYLGVKTIETHRKNLMTKT
ncbi:MAG: response regulator transcription factor, partial [Chitinophagaceae bacterium]|nr:response regulator transcription factor [Chitinophagaceae bacterium]